MKNIELLQRTHVARIGVCEAKSKTTCSDEVAAHLVKSRFAKYADKKSEADAKKEAAALAKTEAAALAETEAAGAA